MRINLNDPDIMDSKEAIAKWSIDDSTLRKRTNDFPEGSIRKIGTSWAVTREGMEAVFGEMKAKEMLKMAKYIINYHTGVKHEIEARNIEQAQDKAFEGISYTQENVTIETFDGKVLSIARWYGVKPEEEDLVLTQIGNGFYWYWDENV